MKVVVSICPTSLEEVQELDADRLEAADIIEWRADYLPKEKILQVAPAVFELCAGREVLFTLRTRSEGGHIDLTDQEYLTLIREVSSLYQPDYIDFEYYSHRAILEEMYEYSNLVLSYHNWQETPEHFMEIMSELTALSPAVVKMAVKANSHQDVLDVMNFTRGFKTLNTNQSYAVYSLGKLGRLSRLAGDVTGSCWTFAGLQDDPETGQMSLGHVRQVLEVLEK